MPPCLFDNKARMLNLVIRIFVYFILLLLLQIIPNVSPIRSKREESKALIPKVNLLVNSS